MDEVKLLRDKLSLDFVGAYLFWGEEEYLKRHYTKELREKIKSEGMADFNLVSVEFEKGADIGDILEALETPPVFAPHKMVEVTGLPLLDLARESEKKLVEAVKKRADDTVLLFYFYADEIDLSSKKMKERAIIKALSEEMMTVQFPRQSREKLLSWTDKIFTADSLHISDVAITRMIELCDYSMMRLRQESEKIVCRAKFENIVEIPREWVDEMVRPSAENAIFELTDAVINRARARACSIFENLAAQNFDPNVLLASVSRALSSLMSLYSAQNSGISVREAAKASGFVQDWQADKYTPALRARTARGLKRSIEKCFECDVLLKSNSANKLLAVETLILELMSEECR